MGKIVYLTISSWKGVSLGATHYYGKLVCDRKHIGLKKKLSAAEAKYLSKKDRCDRKKGDLTDRFRSRGELQALALKVWKKHFPDAIMLVEGRSSVAEPQPVLDGPQELKQRITALAHEAERVGYWDGDWDAMQRICDEWDEIMRSI